MLVDETGAPWPYERIDVPEMDEGEPRWCPDESCHCEYHAPAEAQQRRILFYDHLTRLLPKARCRISVGGRLLNLSDPYADKGGITFALPPFSRSVLLEWAPELTPIGPLYPYRVRYMIDVERPHPENVRRKLNNLGFSAMSGLSDNVRAFQMVYQLPVSGAPRDVEFILQRFYDDLLLPPAPTSESALVAPDEQLHLVQAPQPSNPAPAPVPAPRPGGVNTSPGAATAHVVVRVRVKTRFGELLNGALVELQNSAGQVLQTETTGARRSSGAGKFRTGEVEFLTKQSNTKLIIETSRRHHGPNPNGDDPVVTGKLSASVVVDGGGLVKQEDQTLLPKRADPGVAAVPGVSGATSRDRRLELVLMDAAWNIGKTFDATPTRRLTDAQAQQEFVAHVRDQKVALLVPARVQFKHDPALGDLDPCGTGCVVHRPRGSKLPRVLGDRVTIGSTVGDVKFLSLTAGVRSKARPKEHPGERFLRAKFTYVDVNLLGLDQRNVVGMVRFCERMRDTHGVAAIYHIGFLRAEDGTNLTAKDAHGYGRAIDVGGFATELPPLPAMGTPNQIVGRASKDFHVQFHWGDVPMFDGVLVARHPNDRSKWQRRTPVDNTTDFSVVHSPPKKLQYRLDPPPFQDPDPTGLITAPLVVALHFQEAGAIFRAAYDFFVAEYTDVSDGLPDAASHASTPIDDPRGEFVIHPDYGRPNRGKSANGNPKQNGRGAHANHFHAQLGPTRFAKRRPA